VKLEKFIILLEELGVGFYTGVPDSKLKSLCNYLIKSYGVSDKHIIAANEGNAVALAAGYHLSTGATPCVYLQNSGLGNIVNPVASLLSDKVYGIPCVFVVGWRGEPGLHDEPQHVFQGQITTELLEVMDIDYMVLDKDTNIDDLSSKLSDFKEILSKGKSVAFLVKQGGLEYDEKVHYKNDNSVKRETIIEAITNVAKGDIIIATTGKSSRELFEIRERRGESHKYDFLTVGSMGHSSSIALGVAINKPSSRVWCIDGDGAALMHLGAMPVIGAHAPENYIHVIINNGAHESVGGQPTVGSSIDLVQMALGSGYKKAYSISSLDSLRDLLSEVTNEKGPIMIEIKAAIGSRDDLGRPTTSPKDNKKAFMDFLRECE